MYRMKTVSFLIIFSTLLLRALPAETKVAIQIHYSDRDEVMYVDESQTEFSFSAQTEGRRGIIQSIRGLEGIPNLQVILLSYLDDSFDYSSILSLGNIAILVLRDCSVKDLYPFLSIPQLKSLILQGCRIANINSNYQIASKVFSYFEATNCNLKKIIRLNGKNEKGFFINLAFNDIKELPSNYIKRYMNLLLYYNPVWGKQQKTMKYSELVPEEFRKYIR